MEILIKASQFILSLSLLIVLHELGHFIPAKLFKTRVEKFYLFFDYKFSIFKKKIGETVYGIGWIPLGGYVKISGMIDESMDTEQLQEEPKPWEFRSKPAWQRLIIMLGGVFVNFILGIFIYIMLMYSYGEKYLPNENVTDGVWVQDSLAVSLGLQNGDKILTLDGVYYENFSDISEAILISGVSQVQVQRNSEIVSISIPSNIIEQFIEKNAQTRFIGMACPYIAQKFDNGSVAEAAGGSVNFASFMRGRMDIIVDFNVPDAATAMGVMAAAHASGTFASLEVHECIDNGPVVAAAQRIMKAYVPANA